MIQYAVDHLKAAEKLYELSGRFAWQYLHSTAFLSHLSIELVLKASLLDLEGQFPAGHDLARLFRRLQKKGVVLSSENKKWLDYLNHCRRLRYPDPQEETEVDISNWERTKSLFEELRRHVPETVQKQIVQHERYSQNTKSGKTIWPK